ncbi:MAG TPA: CPBP family intramembrane glutamic endopeptidase, partial [Terriglobales bacterium]
EDGASPVSTRALFGRQFWAGVVWGLVALTLLIVAMRAAGAFYFGGLELHGTRILKFAAFWGVFFIVVGLFEEFLFRGYTQFTVSRGIGFWPAALLLSCIFGGIHLGNKGEAWIGALAAGLIGLFFCLTLRRTGNLWFAVGFHASWDWGETYLYGVPNSGIEMPGQLLNSSLQGSHWLSGGSVGPEGSIFAFILIGLLWVVFDRMYPAANYPR